MPYNISSWAPINVKALNQVDGIEAKAVIYGNANKQHEQEGVHYVPQNNKWQVIKSIWTFYKMVKWADVIHWYYDDKILPFGLALKIIKWSKKPAIVEWLGSDIRDPRIEFKTNPYFEKFYAEYRGDDPNITGNAAIALQEKFGKAGFATLLCPEMKEFLIEKNFQHNFTLRQRISLDAFKDIPQRSWKNGPIKICHAPSKKALKGTKTITKAVEELQNEGYNIEYDLIMGVQHDQAVRRIGNADIFVDQLTGGAYGMAAMEGLCLNRPVLVYIKESNIPNYPEECPVVNCNYDNIKEVIKGLLDDPNRIAEIGNQGANYISKYHDTKTVIPDLINIYKELIALKKNG